ncbi:hypothetical protein QJS10_CPB12g00120 [Acorus calamus]|uniref:Uncharacterized protein n=1 Tax=Acorus calamus TaxID=4465 RepID=A0AAV9DPC4_ACOCL|nr:hypothetical protein QJS10_CPB12g00120 [Acorus calamus]
MASLAFSPPPRHGHDSSGAPPPPESARISSTGSPPSTITPYTPLARVASPAPFVCAAA